MVEKFYSEELRKYFDTKEECLNAEKELAEKKAKAEAEKEEKRQDQEKVKEALYNAEKCLKEFEDKYGYIVLYDVKYSLIKRLVRTLTSNFNGGFSLSRWFD